MAEWDAMMKDAVKNVSVISGEVIIPTGTHMLRAVDLLCRCFRCGEPIKASMADVARAHMANGYKHATFFACPACRRDAKFFANFAQN
ncbi:MAG: hypothetical protein JO116_24500 [Planctomycetaceae bacterium]|nr:hypothetical protein [Planctomycetaceae bacterium]